MALDHTRDFFAATPFDPMDLAQTSPGWYWTRWITNLCAPTFVLLAGVSAFLRQQKAGVADNSRYLLGRGAMLVVLECTWISFSWQFGYNVLILQVIWALGMGMIFLSALIWLPRTLVAVIAAALILPHNLLDALHGPTSGILFKAWHQGGFLPLGEGFGAAFAYPLMPWVGLMAAGYAMGPVFLWQAEKRQRFLWISVAALLLVFVGLRFGNIYGDPDAWSEQAKGGVYSFLSFMRVHKYPPSLLYLCSTLGISLAILAVLDKYVKQRVPVLSLFGRAPLFFYCVHIALIHALAWVYMGWRYDYHPSFVGRGQKLPDGYEPTLLACYTAWAVIIAIMFVLTTAWTRWRDARAAAITSPAPAAGSV
ncbi:membrane protein [Undibacterium terreum]|uniref:Membrane protein n=2 Tax=Undibacterium terreum TaxID=1224302 RepID=A0A916V1C3_9BURK|nr:membrane protein [Undibacterium terreum]